MTEGQIVEVRLHGDQTWYQGTVINARKMWVEIEGFPDANGQIVDGGKRVMDESSIAEWREA